MCGFLMKKSNHKHDIEIIKNQITSNAELPKDVVLGVPIITITGKQELLIENHRGIIEYTDHLIRVQTKNGQVRITGNQLRIIYYTNDELKISGQIVCVEYVK